LGKKAKREGGGGRKVGGLRGRKAVGEGWGLEKRQFFRSQRERGGREKGGWRKTVLSGRKKAGRPTGRKGEKIALKRKGHRQKGGITPGTKTSKTPRENKAQTAQTNSRRQVADNRKEKREKKAARKYGSSGNREPERQKHKQEGFRSEGKKNLGKARTGGEISARGKGKALSIRSRVAVEETRSCPNV